MNWTEVSIYTTTNGIEIINGGLQKLGINDAVIEDAKVFEDFLNNDTMNWDYYDEDLEKMKDIESSIKVYVADNAQGRDQLSKIYKLIEDLQQESYDIGMGRLKVETRIINDNDWANSWKQYFKPFIIGDKIIIKPSWEEYRDSTEDKIILEIDPGMSFGTGQHHTTRLCIEELIKYLTDDMEVLDIGCGSGILSIAALLLGAKSCVGVDIDESAVQIAKENAALNNIFEDKFKAYEGNVTDVSFQEKIAYKKYDIIVVNIIAQIIMDMSHTFPIFLKKGGLLIASGIIKKHLEELIDNLENQGFEIIEINDQEEWVAVTAKFQGKDI